MRCPRSSGTRELGVAHRSRAWSERRSWPPAAALLLDRRRRVARRAPAGGVGAGGSGGSCRGLGGVERWRQRTPWSSFVRVCSGCWASKPGTRRGPGPTLCARPNVSGPKFRLTSFCNFASAGLFIHFIIFFALHKLTILFFVFSFFFLNTQDICVSLY